MALYGDRHNLPVAFPRASAARDGMPKGHARSVRERRGALTREAAGYPRMRHKESGSSGTSRAKEAAAQFRQVAQEELEGRRCSSAEAVSTRD